ncbi:hypothetical protein A1F99_125840 [Pyrenophora tritici-repentis]|nr:hypothetical protein A1F99_125840 [Pyrenophora tritici-repentis]
MDAWLSIASIDRIETGKVQATKLTAVNTDVSLANAILETCAHTGDKRLGVFLPAMFPVQMQ